MVAYVDILNEEGHRRLSDKPDIQDVNDPNELMAGRFIPIDRQKLDS